MYLSGTFLRLKAWLIKQSTGVALNMWGKYSQCSKRNIVISQEGFNHGYRQRKVV